MCATDLGIGATAHHSTAVLCSVSGGPRRRLLRLRRKNSAWNPALRFSISRSVVRVFHSEQPAASYCSSPRPRSASSPAQQMALAAAIAINIIIATSFRSSVAAVSSRRPNLLFLASDDLRPQLGAFQPEGWAGRHAPPVTPHIDALANRSMVFLRSYCQQAICMATRASLLTGRRPDTTGITVDLGSYWRTRGGNFTSLPQHFRDNGYATVGHGKIFHCGPCSGGTTRNYSNPGPQHPTVQGDDHPYAWTLDDPELLLNGYYHAPNELYSVCSAAPGYGTPCPGGGMGDRITPSYGVINASSEAAVPLVDQQLADKAIRTLGILADRSKRSSGTPPWFVACGFHLPHLPDLVPQRFVDLYPDAGMPDNDYAPDHMPLVAWSASGELNQYHLQNIIITISTLD
jgi:iduronate 2-sulfatase